MGTHDAGGEVIHQHKGFAAENNSEIQHRQLQNIVGTVHHAHHGTGNSNAQTANKNAQNRAQQNAGVHGKPQAVLVLCALEVGADDIRTHRQTKEQIDDQVNGRAGSADGSQGGLAVFGELTHHDLVGSVVKLLQKVGGQDGQGEDNELC